MPRRVGIKKSTIAKATRDERAAVKLAKKTGAADSFQNWGLNLGIGTNNALTGSTYGFNPVTRNRTMLEWIHRGSWIGGVAVDVIPKDMTRGGIDLQSTMKPDDAEEMDRAFVDLGIWHAVECVCKWSRLYGGAIGVYLIDGQDVRTPLRMETIQKGQFRGIAVLDRWMVDSDQQNLVQELGPFTGQPEFYRVNLDAPALRGKVIHYSRIFRMVGIELPYWQSVMENLWGISVIERMYDRMVAFDSATQGAAQAVYKCYLRHLKIKDFRQLASTGGKAYQGLATYVEMMRVFQGIEGITCIDSEDDFQVVTPNVSSGIAEALVQFGQQIAGALEMPLTRLFGQSPQGMNATGEADLITYYDGIKQKQENNLRVPLLKICRMIAQSRGIVVDDKFNFEFTPLWQMSEEMQSNISKADTESVLSVDGAGLLPQKTILQELRERGRRTGRWSNITDEILDAADEEMPPTPEELAEAGGEPEGGEPGSPPLSAGKPKPGKPPASAKQNDRRSRATDSDLPVSEVAGFQVVIEARRGERRWPDSPVLRADYGFVRRVPSAEGPQEWMDCFVGDEPNCGHATVVDMIKSNGAFDEHKVVFAMESHHEACEVVRDFYADLDVSVGKCTRVPVQVVREWFERGDLSRPFADQINPRRAA